MCGQCLLGMSFFHRATCEFHLPGSAEKDEIAFALPGRLSFPDESSPVLRCRGIFKVGYLSRHVCWQVTVSYKSKLSLEQKIIYFDPGLI